MLRRISKAFIWFLAAAVMLASASAVSADDSDDDNGLTLQDSFVTTIINKSVIHGSLLKDSSGNLLYDSVGYVRFAYSGDIYSVKTDKKTGELKALKEKIGTIQGEAAFPPDFVALSAGVNALMDAIMAGQTVTFPKMPPVVPWTCNKCYMVVGDSTYVSIVDALDPVSGNPDMINQFNEALIGGAAGARESMRLQGRAFTGITPASFDPATKTMSVRMAGCSAVVGISGSQAGKLGTLCLNSTATFNVSGAIPVFNSSGELIGYEPNSQITADGTSNCTTVLHAPTM